MGFYLIAGTFLVIFGLTAGFILATPLWRQKRRRALMATPIPPEWDGILNKDAALYRFLPNELKPRLHKLMRVFLAEKNFEACGGLELTEEIKITISGQACLLLLGQKNPTFYPALKTILVYPHAYVAQTKKFNGAYVEEGVSARLGESWQNGSVVLAWDHARQTAIDARNGHNVVLHEFAHQLDQEDGQADGAPVLEQGSSYAEWSRVLGGEFTHLQGLLKWRMKTDIDPYGATNPAEFFAVATEFFFEKGQHMRRRHPELYEELKNYYHLDPADWF